MSERKRQTEVLRALEQSQRELLKELIHRVEILESHLLVRDNGATLSAEAYDGLRKTVQAAMKSRTAFLVALADIDRTLGEAQSLEGPRVLLDDLLRQEGLTRTGDSSDPTAFRIIAGEGDLVEPLTPAYIDDASGRVVVRGTARLVESDQGATGSK